MSGLLFLTNEDFKTEKDVRGTLLCHTIGGYSLILYYSRQCQYCENLLEIFKKLPGSVGGCKFGIMNITKNRQFIELSNTTITPLKYVPYIVLYFNGVPIMNYKGKYDGNEIVKFIIEIANNLKKKQQFSKEKVQESKEEPLPTYCTGKPICGGKDQNVCYVSFNKDDGYAFQK
jgi:hypothetical protein